MTNTKKKHGNKMKLMSAIGMLTVSAAMLVSSTFAWFSMNKQVSAQTMSISAKSADPIIEISADGSTFANNLYTSGTDTNWTLPSTTDVKLKLVTPTAISTATGTVGDVSWGWASSTAHDNAQVTNATTPKSLVAQSTPAATNNGRSAYLGVEGDALYVLKQKLTVRNVSVDVNATNLVIENVTIDKGTNSIGDAVRVLFVNSAGQYALYKPAASGTTATLVTDHQWLDPATGTAPATDMTQTSANLPIIAAELAAKGTGATPVAASSTDIDVYVFFDGTDTIANTDNATDLSAVSISFGFKID